MARRATAAAMAGGLWLLLLAGCGSPAQQVSRSVNGCDPSQAVDRTGAAEVEIHFGGEHDHLYDPSCVRVSVGTRVTFVGDFKTHPFGPGELAAPVGETDPANPLRETESGDRASFVMDRPGTYPYLCNLHAWHGMMGAVFVE